MVVGYYWLEKLYKNRKSYFYFFNYIEFLELFVDIYYVLS